MRNQSIKFLLIISFILACKILTAQTKTLVKNDSIKFKFDQKYISISPLISPRICLGLTSTYKLENQHLQEAIIYFHAFDTFSTYKVYGIATRNNTYFLRNTKHGFFGLWNFGFDFIQMESINFNIGGSNSNDKNEIITQGFVNLAIGLGYSFKLKNDSYIRLEWDVGFKWFLSNIYISYVW
ncbi:MAG: hypothetical protein U9P73_11860 [Candidatus Cloacimonadota bacterium]|nr:hypothetical protein [Candidatus Cloacimonadota bacterium]